MNITNKVRDYIKDNRMIEPGDRVIIGVSGGADSVCLTLLLQELSKEMKFELGIVNVEHGIRGEESIFDSAYVKRLASEHDLPFFGFSVDVPRLAMEQKLSMEEAARNARYESFDKAAEEFGATKIAVAHNANDNAETIIFNMGRGTSIAGMSGIKPVNERIIRPILCVSREEVEAFLEERNTKFVTDSTNFDTEITRNKIRLEVIPKLQEVNEEAVLHINALASDMALAYDYIEAQATDKFKKLTHLGNDGLTLDISKVKGEPELLKREIIKLCITTQAGRAKDISRVHVEAVCDLLEGGTGKSVNLPYGVTAETSYDKLVFKSVGAAAFVNPDEEIEIPTPGEIEVQNGKLVTSFPKGEEWQIDKKVYTKLIDYDKIKDKLVLRHRKSGDVITVDESGGHAKLKDYFINEKIPKDQRDTTWLVADGSEIVWIIGMRLSEKYKITNSTRKVLCLEMMEEE